MSGFVAVLDTAGGPVDAELLTRMTDAMSFRGLDGVRTWTRAHVGLGHALLRTTQESADETQPCTLDGGVWIAADARIDARPELIRSLRAHRQELADDTPDPELILHAYEVWGDACLDRLIGDFAFVLWDGPRRRLFAARDQFGVAQLFYTHVGNTVLLGNTLHSLFAHADVDRTPDEQTLADVALFSVPLDDAATGYRAIRRVPPGHSLASDAHGLHLARYWSMPNPPSLRSARSRADLAAEFRHVFDLAVGDRLRTNAVGTQLSGGMDSSSIAVTAHHLLQASGQPFDLRGYAIEFTSLIPDEEGRLASEVGRFAGFPVEILAGETHVGAEPPMWAPPEPGAATIGVMAEVCRRCSEFSRVLLTGFGGDPLLHPPTATARRSVEAIRSGNLKWPARQVVVGARRSRERRRHRPLPQWVNPEWARRLDLGERRALFLERSGREQRSLADAALWRALFAWSDAGYHGLPLQIRFPFFDLRLLELVLSLPPVPWLERKHVLRTAMVGRLPEAVRTRPKTVMSGNVTLTQNSQVGVPAWQLELLGAPEMSPYLDHSWLQVLRRESPARQAAMWERERPPVDVAFWLRNRPGWPVLHRSNEP